MKAQIKRWLTPPVFLGDEKKTRRAMLLNVMINGTAIYLMLLALGNMLSGRPSVGIFLFLFDIIGVFVVLLLHYWLQHGNIRMVEIGLSVFGFLWITLVSAKLGTIRTPTTSLYLFMVILSGLLFDSKGILFSTIASSLAVLGLILAENAGLLPRPDYTVTLTQWLTYTGLFGITGSLVFFTLQTTREALARAEREIEERGRVEGTLRKLSRAVEQSPASIVITDLDGIIEYVNPRFSQVTGYSFNEAVGKNPRILKTDQTPLGTHHQLWTVLIAGKEWRGEFVNRKKDGSLYYEAATISPIIDLNGVCTHYLAVKEDITERKHAEDALRIINEQLNLRVAEVEQLQTELREQALHDPLTELYNRRYLSEALLREIVRAERENNHLSLIVSDIDHFKKINDTYGHQAGDKFLVEIAGLMKRHARGSDFVCRYGGEEFLLVLPGVTAACAESRAEKIRQRCAEICIHYEGKDLMATMSLGVATYPDHGQAIEEIIIKADKALYASKHNGRNRVTVWSEDQV
ncbi:MAG: diguanylate cyclase [Chloroflexales bacterium]